MKKQIFTLLFVAMASLAFGQKPKQFFDLGQKQMAAQNYQEASLQFSEAIKLDPQMANAYLYRAECNDKLGKWAESLDDYRKLGTFKVKDKSYCYDAARVCHDLKLYDEGLGFAEQVMDIKKKKFDGLVIKSQLQMAKGDYANALTTLNMAIAMQNKTELHHNKAIAYDKLDNPTESEKEYLAAIALKNDNINALNELATLQLRNNKADEALVNSNKVIAIDANNQQAYLTKAAVEVKKMDYPSAINDMSRIIMLAPNDAQLYMIRGTYYQDFTQHQNAINDFNKVLLLDNKNVDGYYKRAYSYEQVANYPMAIKDYNKIAELSQYDGKAQELLEMANKRLFELNRESVKPKVVLSSPMATSTNRVNAPIEAKSLTLVAQIVDDSDIKSVKVNFVDVPFEKKMPGAAFSAQVNLANVDSFYVTATDIYDNTQETMFVVSRTEINTPKISLLAPYATDNGEVFLDIDAPTLYVEGQVGDESLIGSIMIDDVLASYAVNDLNPRFMATVPINNRDSFTVTAKDAFGNIGRKTIRINRQAAGLLELNPMGRTWAVFIENSNYEKFPSLDGPSRDVTLMRSALTGYDIHNIIHKKNMSKTEMERFFAIELRDLIKANNVRSVLIWYAGHGKFVNETGYWIPIDANRDDEFSYYGINSLKASMQNYNTNVSHTLVVTDACESGPTFYQAMRGTIVERSCNDWEATKLKSSQVFTSAGYELAIDNSQFTKTFANMLANNPNSCIPIESIVLKVTQVVSENNQQRPRFGKIAGLGDEDGTFFFINAKK